MILQVVAVRDRAADVYTQPQYVVSIGMSIRGFSDEINRVAPDNMLNKHPEDFDLYHLGTYDDSTASFVMLTVPRQIAIGKDVVRA